MNWNFQIFDGSRCVLFLCCHPFLKVKFLYRKQFQIFNQERPKVKCHFTSKPPPTIHVWPSLTRAKINNNTTTKMLSAHFSARSTIIWTGHKNSSDQRKNLWFIGKILAFRSVDAWKQSPIRLEKWQTGAICQFFY